MGVGTKKMANTVAAAHDDSFGGKIKSWPERIKSFYNDVRTETRKVTSPSLKEVQATTAVVIVAVFLFGLYFFIVDYLINAGVERLFRAFTQ
jgi:preprotein translocase subunit SecE